MVRTFKIFLVTVSLPLVLLACGKEAPKEAPQPVKKAQPAQPQTQQKAETTDRAASIDSTIDARHRNPFQSHIVLMKGVESQKKVKGPLECCELNQFRLIAVVLGSDGSYALVQAPDSKRYIVRHGDIMGAREGKIVRFEPRGIVVRELERDENGKVTATTDTELKLPAEKGQ